MTKEAIFSQLQEIIAAQLGFPKESVMLYSKFADDFGCDSLDTVELRTAISDGFQCEIPEDAADSMPTVGAVVNYLAGKC
jgi:acyl carrier protein